MKVLNNDLKIEMTQYYRKPNNSLEPIIIKLSWEKVGFGWGSKREKLQVKGF